MSFGSERFLFCDSQASGVTAMVFRCLTVTVQRIRRGVRLRASEVEGSSGSEMFRVDGVRQCRARGWCFQWRICDPGRLASMLST